MIHGGRLIEIGKPWRFRYQPQGDERRPITIRSHVWEVCGPALGASGHHQASIREEDNCVWDPKGLGFPREKGEDPGAWVQPYAPEYNEPGYKEHQELIAGRQAYNSDFIKKKDVVKWAVDRMFKEWGITSKTHKITWDLDEDDPMADIALARHLKERAERGD